MTRLELPVAEETLSLEEIAKAGWVAVERMRRARAANRRLEAGEALADQLERDALGAAGECAFAQFLAIPWRPSVEPDTAIGDVAGWQVRTRSEHWHELILRPREETGRFVLVTAGDWPTFAIRGWFDAARRSKEGTWNTDLPDPGYCIGQAALSNDFREYAQEER